MSITTAKMLMGVINNHILNYCEGDALTEAAECSRQVEDELTKAQARIAELETLLDIFKRGHTGFNREISDAEAKKAYSAIKERHYECQ